MGNVTYVDPMEVCDDDYKKLLKMHGLDSFPNRLDLQQVIHFDSKLRLMVSLSFYTEIPYCVSLKKNGLQSMMCYIAELTTMVMIMQYIKLRKSNRHYM